MLKKDEMQEAVDAYLKDAKRGKIGGPFVVARFAAEILHSRERLLTHQNLFVRFIPEKAHKWLAGYLMRGCLETWGKEACEECIGRQADKTPLSGYEKEHATMVRMMKWYWIKNTEKVDA